MIYLVAGVLSSAFMLLYKQPPGPSSPLYSLKLESDSVAKRLFSRNSRLVSGFGLVCSFLCLFLVAASRYGIGTDYWSRHVPVFEQIRGGYDTDYEPGFTFLNSVTGNLTDDPQWLIALVSFLTLFLTYRFILRMSLDPALSVLVLVIGGFYLEAFNLAQQALAIAILLNTIELALRRQHLLFLGGTLLAASIHSSAFIWLAIWPLLLLRAGRFWRLLLVLAAAAATVGASQVLIAMSARLAPEYAWYLTSDYGEARAINAGVLLVSFALLILIMIFVPGGSKGDNYSDALVNLQAICVLLLLASVTVAYFFSRLIYYFSPIQMIVLPLLLATLRGKHGRVLVWLLFVALYLVAFTYQFLVWNAHGVMPYESVFTR